VSLKKMNLFDHRLAAILQIRTVLAARMFELRDLRRPGSDSPTKPKDDEGECDQRPRFLNRLMPSQLTGRKGWDWPSGASGAGGVCAPG